MALPAQSGVFQQPQPVSKALATGTVASSYGTIYTTPIRQKCVISFGVFHNKAATTETVLVRLQSPAAVNSIIARGVLAPNETLRILDNGEVLTLSPGWLVQATTTNASSVDYSLTGYELFIPSGGQTV